MNCPICNNPMRINSSDISHNFKSGTKYTRTYYVCDTDDVWINSEIPLPNSDQHIA